MSAPDLLLTNRPAEDCPLSLVVLQAQYARDARDRMREEVARRADRLMSILGIVATAVAAYDLVLLTHLGTW